MDLYYWLFPPIMMALPLALVWGAEYILPPAPNVPWRRWGKALLPAVTVLVIAGYLAAFAVFGKVAWVTHGLAYLYFPLWGFAMALTIRPDPNFGEKNLNRVERTASLTPRRRESPITSGWWTTAWVVAIVGAALLLGGALVLRAPALTLMQCAIFGGAAVFCVGFTQWFLPTALEEPEPLAAEADPSLQLEYARCRHQRVWTLFAMFAHGMPLLMLGVGGGALWALGSAASGATLGMVGGILGTLFGIIGACAGVWADFKRKRLREMLAKTETAQASDQTAMST